MCKKCTCYKKEEWHGLDRRTEDQNLVVRVKLVPIQDVQSIISIQSECFHTFMLLVLDLPTELNSHPLREQSLSVNECTVCSGD